MNDPPTYTFATWPALSNASDLWIAGARACVVRGTGSDAEVVCRDDIERSEGERIEPGTRSPRAFLGSITPICVREASGVACFGYDEGGALLGRDGWGYDGTTHGVSRPSVLQSAVRVVTGNGFGCALRDDDQVVCWGWPPGTPSGERFAPEDFRTARPPEVIPLSGVIDVAADAQCAYLLQRGGAVYCWGRSSDDAVVQLRPFPLTDAR